MPAIIDLPPERRAFCANLRAAREEHGFNQGEMAKALGVSQPAYNQVEKGKHDPKLSTIVRAAAVLGVEPGDLINTKSKAARDAAKQASAAA